MKNLRTLKVWFIGLMVASLALIPCLPIPLEAQIPPPCTVKVTDYATFTACSGTLPDGRGYGFEVPTTDWNGTVVVLSLGYVPPSVPGAASVTIPESEAALPPILSTLDDQVSHWLLQNGYALTVAFGGPGWSIRRSITNQIQTLDIFASMFGAPTRTIAYGGSLGGFITAGLIQEQPNRFDGGMSISAPLAGSIGTWNQALDFAFVVQQLLGPESGLAIVHITNPGSETSGNWGLAWQLLTDAQATPEGRARIALASATMDIPGWFDPFSPEPPADDYATQESNQFLWARDVVTPQAFGYGRYDIELRSSGNPSWNIDVNYEGVLENSISHDEVAALYAAAGLSLEDDLELLKQAPRIAANPASIDILTKNLVFTGNTGGLPFLTLHNTGDGLIDVQHEYAYRSAFLSARHSQLLRQAYVHRSGHSALTPAEIIAGLQALFQRIDTGKWESSASPESLNAAALALGPAYNVLPPAYFEYEPAKFSRPYDLAVASPPPGPVPGKVLTPTGAGSTLYAWPLPYRGGSLQVSFSPDANMDRNTRVSIYDLSGRRVRVLGRNDPVGSRALQWDGRNDRGLNVPDGIYFLRSGGSGPNAQLKFVVIR